MANATNLEEKLPAQKTTKKEMDLSTKLIIGTAAYAATFMSSFYATLAVENASQIKDYVNDYFQPTEKLEVTKTDAGQRLNGMKRFFDTDYE